MGVMTKTQVTVLTNLVLLAAVTTAQNVTLTLEPSTIVSTPYELTYLLEAGFAGNLTSINSLLKSASQAPFIAYDPSFLDIIGPSPQLELIQARPNKDFAYESGVWVPSTNEVWFTSASAQAPTTANVLNLATNEITPLNANPPVQNPNGAYFYNDTVTFATFRDNPTYRGGIVTVDPITRKSATILNSYFGLPFSSPDDPVWVRRDNNSYLFFSDLNFLATSTPYTNLPPASLSRGIWRFDPQEQLLSYVISRTDVPSPNGLRVSPDQKTLSVTDDGSAEFISEATNVGTATSRIYVYDVDEEVMPVNKRVFGLARDGIADGLHVDDAGRVWTGGGSGITARAPSGMLWSFNSQVLLKSREASVTPLVDFALAGDTLIILALDRLYRVMLAQQVVSPGSLVVN